MARIKKHHDALIDGVGKCSVPMWSSGLPDGFCGRPAYGCYVPGPTARDGYTGKLFRLDGKYYGYVPALACPIHGGPSAPEPNK